MELSQETIDIVIKESEKRSLRDCELLWIIGVDVTKHLVETAPPGYPTPQDYNPEKEALFVNGSEVLFHCEKARSINLPNSNSIPCFKVKGAYRLDRAYS